MLSNLAMRASRVASACRARCEQVLQELARSDGCSALGPVLEQEAREKEKKESKKDKSGKKKKKKKSDKGEEEQPEAEAGGGWLGTTAAR